MTRIENPYHPAPVHSTFCRFATCFFRISFSFFKSIIYKVSSSKGDMEKAQNPVTLFLMPKSATQALKTPVFGPDFLIFQQVAAARPRT